MSKFILLSIFFFLSLELFGQEELNIHKFPIPKKTSERLFYIQRSLNKNTIVYDANYTKDGLLNKKHPVKVYWIRFEENGVEKPLRIVEKKLAFGVRIEKLNNSQFNYKVKIAALNKRYFYIKQKGAFKSEVFIKTNGRFIPLDHIFVNVDERYYLSSVESIELYGGERNPMTTNVETILF